MADDPAKCCQSVGWITLYRSTVVMDMQSNTHEKATRRRLDHSLT